MKSNFFKKALPLLLALMFAIGSFSVPFVATATSTSALRDKKQKIQAQIDAANDKIDELAKDKSETQDYLTALTKKVTLLQDELDVLEDEATSLRNDIQDIQNKIDAIQAKINKVEAEITQTEKEIEKKQAEFDKTYDEYCQRLRAMYISGSTTTLEVLLTSTDMSSILTRAQMVKSVSEKDSETLDTLMKQMEEIEKDKEKLVEKKTELKESKASLVKDRTSLESKKAELDKSISEYNSKKASLDSQVDECNSLIAKLDSQTKEYSEYIVASKAEQHKIDAEINAQLNANTSYGASGGNSSAIKGTGQFMYPTNYTKISAGYPAYSSGAYHGGVDFPCPSGSNVYAADSGTVVTATYHYSWGNYVLIDHGNHLYTLYAHNSSLKVSAGQSVKKGQVIAKSGSTGNSTGPHCHFEVHDGGPGTTYRVNPMNYL